MSGSLSLTAGCCRNSSDYKMFFYVGVEQVESLSSCRPSRFSIAVSRSPTIRAAQTCTAPPPPQVKFLIVIVSSWCWDHGKFSTWSSNTTMSWVDLRALNVTRTPAISLPAASLPASIVSSSSSSSSSVTSHMVYPGSHTVMYAASTPSLGDGSLTVLNTFPPTGHAQSHDPSKTQVWLCLRCREADASY